MLGLRRRRSRSYIQIDLHLHAHVASFLSQLEKLPGHSHQTESDSGFCQVPRQKSMDEEGEVGAGASSHLESWSSNPPGAILKTCPRKEPSSS
jgi:hypothetical protein